MTTENRIAWQWFWLGFFVALMILCMLEVSRHPITEQDRAEQGGYCDGAP